MELLKDSDLMENDQKFLISGKPVNFPPPPPPPPPG